MKEQQIASIKSGITKIENLGINKRYKNQMRSGSTTQKLINYIKDGKIEELKNFLKDRDIDLDNVKIFVTLFREYFSTEPISEKDVINITETCKDYYSFMCVEMTPLLFAIGCGNLDIINLMLKHGSDIDSKIIEKEYFFLGTKENNINNLNYNPFVCSVKKYFSTALYMAMRSKNLDVIKAVLERGVVIKDFHWVLLKYLDKDIQIACKELFEAKERQSQDLSDELTDKLSELTIKENNSQKLDYFETSSQKNDEAEIKAAGDHYDPDFSINL